MKKSIVDIIISLVLVLIISLGFAALILPLIKNRITYSETACLNDRLTSDMSMTEIANTYIENNATVAIICSGINQSGAERQFLGSGVCVASNGYTVNYEGVEYTASMGSYIATNYHVIDLVDKPEYSDVEITIIAEDESESLGTVLWYDKDTDVAIVYTEKNFNYIAMKDKVVDCSEEEHYNIEDVFIIGTPLNLTYLNRVTCGNIATNHAQNMATLDTIYISINKGINFTFERYANSFYSFDVLSNIYEDVIDVNVSITGGNSGGGCFDKEGYLIGLATLGTDINATGGIQMNGVIPIYPIMKVLDRVILNKENQENFKIYTLTSLGIKGVDILEANYCSSYPLTMGDTNYYFIDGKFYPESTYSYAFSLKEEGYYVIETDSKSKKLEEQTIKSCTLNGKMVTISKRNDLIYLLLNVKEGDNVKFDFNGSKSATITF